MKRSFALILMSILLSACSDRAGVVFTLHAGEESYLDCPVGIRLESIFEEVPDAVVIQELDNNSRIPCQIDADESGTYAWFTIPGIFEAGSTRQYKISPDKKRRSAAGTKLGILQDDDYLTFTDQTSQVLSYRKSVMFPPEGVDTLYKRSGFIHPLFSPSGEVLTRVQPPDHYHHYGIWNPWTKTHINGREIDYWNLAKGEGTVRAKAILSSYSGPVFSSFIALQEHVDFGAEEGERVTMDELWDLRYWGKNIQGTRYTLDLSSTIINLLQDTILFDAYRYGGGLGFRATEKWNSETCTVLTSEGNDRSTADGSKARWCMVEGISDAPGGRSGILFLSHPSNREHPEPMRVWPDDVNNGEMFFEFCPIRHTEWKIVPAKEYTLKYRMIVFDGKMSPEEAEMYWNAFAFAPEMEVK